MLKISKKLHLVTTLMKNFSTIKYSNTYEWIKLIDKEKKIADVGLSKYAISKLGDIVYVSIDTDINDIKDKNEVIGDVESVKSTSEINLPVKGEIIEINEEVIDVDINVINDEPENRGWLVKIIVDDLKDLDELNDNIDE
jgi:glycine cleavage system H protein